MHLDNVAPDSLRGVPRVQTNPKRWDGTGWEGFKKELKQSKAGLELQVSEAMADRSIFVTDAGGLAYGMPHGILRPGSADDIAAVLKAAQKHKVPVTVRGGGLGTEGEAVAFGGLLIDMQSLNRVIAIDRKTMTVRTEAGIFWHHLAEELRREGLDYLSAPLNFTSTVGGVLGVGGVDINSAKFGCSADQALALKVVTPTGEVVECSATENKELFDRVIFGYGQFGVIAEAVLKIRPFTPLKMHYYYYSSLRSAMEDLRLIVEGELADYSGILTIMDKAITLLVAFDTDEAENTFLEHTEIRLRGHGELGFALRSALYYGLRPWRFKEALFLAERRFTLFPDLQRSEHMDKDGKVVDRTVLFSRAVWRHWGDKKMTIPDISTGEDDFVEAVMRGNEVCKKYFKYYTMYCVGIKKMGDGSDNARYEMSCISERAKRFAYGCEFEPVAEKEAHSRDYLQRFKNEIYDIAVDTGLCCYRFGGMMRGYIRRLYGDEVVDRHRLMKKKADPASVLNKNTVF
ncbi:MAG: FAD-binding oxidoreductase [Thermodesulfobacteriota bacterium]